ncbi:MAG: tRNA (N6-threonylcarbamoyladenosine(37)-N6)-methyltransferase TrmO [Chloroflexi bacterium]|nr:tRNA (N6-threonylcarbamoyladenosine(37)-N6)-methyltransferase TrmO [Chloroflexota bacterium]
MNWIRRLIARILRLFGMGGQAVPREPVSMAPIAVVRNAVFDPKPDGWENVRSDLIFRDDLVDAIDGLDEFSHVIVIFACHRVPDAARTPRLAAPGRGILATRSQLRPNSLGVAVVRLVRRRRNILRVIGLDAIDGTPILDIKPYLPHYDSAPEAQIPDWAQMPEGPEGDSPPSADE